MTRLESTCARSTRVGKKGWPGLTSKDSSRPANTIGDCPKPGRYGDTVGTCLGPLRGATSGPEGGALDGFVSNDL